MTCGEFLKLLQDNPDCELVFQKIVRPYNPNTNSTVMERISNLNIKVESNEVIIESNPFE